MRQIPHTPDKGRVVIFVIDIAFGSGPKSDPCIISLPILLIYSIERKHPQNARHQFPHQSWDYANLSSIEA